MTVVFKAFFYTLAVTLFAGHMYTQKVEMYNDCLPDQKMQMRMFKEGKAYIGTGTEDRYGVAFQLYIDRKTHEFVVLGFDYETLQGCILIKGTDWTPIIG